MKNDFFLSAVFVLLIGGGLCASGNQPSTAAKIKGAAVFTTSIVWVGEGEPAESESVVLLETITNLRPEGIKQGISALEAFITQNSQSPWNPSLHVHLAEHYRNNGRYSLALSHWESAWTKAKNRKDAVSREVATRAVAGWTRLLGSLGRKDEQAGLFAEAKQLELDHGALAPSLQATREGHETMKRKPEVSYRCGSFALAHVANCLSPASEAWKIIRGTPSPDGGFKLSQLVELAGTNGYAIVAVRRETGDTIVVPSVVHWKLDHYAAILERNGDHYLVTDPTFGGKKWLEADVINAEASGNFLISPTNLPTGWRALSPAEAALIHGKGFPNNIDDGDDDSGGDEGEDCPPPPPGDGGGAGGGGDECEDSGDGDTGGQLYGGDGNGGQLPGDGSGGQSYDLAEAGMPSWRVSEPYITLWIHDTPLFYRSSDGPVKLRLSYKHRGSSKGSTIPGFGDKWECDWIGFLERPAGMVSYVSNYLAGGGMEAHGVGSDGSSTPNQPTYKSARQLNMISNVANAIVEAPYAKQNQYGFPFTYDLGPKRYFLTNRVDQYSRSVKFTYTSNYISGAVVIRLTHVTDKDGKQCTLAYTNTSFPNLITSVTDPYTRSARFIYDHQGRLTNITDMAGMPSSFKYDGNGSITNLHTPYGDTSFRYLDGTNTLAALNRTIEITEPTGAKQLYAYHDDSPGNIGEFDSFEGGWHQYRNSFHWNRQQYAALTEEGRTNVLEMPVEDYRKASIKHWLHGAEGGPPYSVIGTLSGMAGPVVDTNATYRINTVAFQYVGQDGPFAGTLKRVTDIRWNFGANQMQFVRNNWGRPTQIIYFRNNVPVSFTNVFNANGRILREVWGPNGERMRGYNYDTTLTNLLTSVTNALGHVLRFTFDSAVRQTSVTRASGLVTTNLYYTSGDYAGFLKTSMNVGFRTNSFGYLNGNRASSTNALGLVRNYTWDNLNRHTRTLFPDGTTVSNVYDKLDLIAAKDRMTHWTYFGYNALRQLVAHTNANQHVTLYDYCNCGSPSEITRLNGSTPLITTFAYDIAGRRTNVTYADGYFKNFVYVTDQNYEIDRGGPIRVEDASGLAVHFDYADYGSLANAGLSQLPDTTVDGYLVQRAYDMYGRLRQAINRNGVTVTNGYDILGRLTNRAVIDMAGQLRGTNSFTYTTRGLTNSINELGKKTWSVYDAAGRLLSQTNANGEVLQFTYNPADQMLTLKDGKNQQTSWNYNQYGQVTNKVDAASTEIFRYKYDPNGQLTNRWTAAKGDTFYAYDHIGSLTNVDYPGSVLDIALRYDGLGRLTNVVDAIGTTKFSYTDAGQLLSEDGPWSDDTVSYTYSARRRSGMTVAQANASPWTQSYGYDEYNRLTNVTSPAGAFAYTYDYYISLSDLVVMLKLPDANDSAHIAKTYDLLGRLTETALNNSVTVQNSHGYQLNDANQRTRQTFLAGNYVDYTYDAIGQLKTAKGWEYGGSVSRLNEKFGYEYDAAWNLNRRTNNALVQTFSTDNRNQLTSAGRSGTLTVAGVASQPGANLDHVTVSGTGLSSGNAEVYADGAWARTNATLADGNNSYTAAAEDIYGRTASDTINLSLPSTINFQYDGNGNLTNDGRRVFEYDFENQLTNVYVASAWRSEFRYDAFGRRRVRKEYTWQSSAWVLTNELRYVYDEMLVMQERDANNLALVSYSWGMDLSGGLQDVGGIGGLLARTDHSTLIAQSSTAHSYYHADGNGNITTMVNTNGIVVARYQYDPYGNLLGMSGPLAEANSYRFSSKEWHANAGLYYYGYRYYEPNLQRWLNRDLIAEDGGINLYAFVINQGINFVDPFGLDPEKCDDFNIPPEDLKPKPQRDRSHYPRNVDPEDNLDEITKAKQKNQAAIESIKRSEQEAKASRDQKGRDASKSGGGRGGRAGALGFVAEGIALWKEYQRARDEYERSLPGMYPIIRFPLDQPTEPSTSPFCRQQQK